MDFSSLQLPLVLICSILMVSFFLISQKSKMIKTQSLGLLQIKGLKTLIVLIQKHRGMTSGIISGDNSLKPELAKVSGDIHREVNKLQQEQDLADNERWLGFLEHWEKLQSQALTLTPDNCFKQHTLLISNLLFLLEDKAEQQLLSATYTPNFSYVGVLWRELLHVSECIGQARALGTSVLASEQCTSVAKIRLTFLHQKIESISDSVYHIMDVSGGSSKELPIQLDEAKRKVTEFIQLIKEELLTDGVSQVSAQSYFNTATSALDAYILIFDTQVELISESFQKKKS